MENDIKKQHTFAICAYGESPYLEECIQSVLNQKIKTNVILVTSTPNEVITEMTKKYSIPLFVNEGESGITQDWNFAYKNANTRYVTITHQDDVYNPEYTEMFFQYKQKSKKPLIFFTDYGELRNGAIVNDNQLLKIKRVLLRPLENYKHWNKKWIRRRILSFGSPICCPSVTFDKENLPQVVFRNHFRSNEDWEAWESLSKLDGDFIYCKKILMYHRIHRDSETSKIIQDNQRIVEDYEMFRKFWPSFIAKFITRIYQNSEKSNNI